MSVLALPQLDLLCVRCAQTQKTCCQTSEVYLTPGDRVRIAAHTGDDDFYEFREPEDPVYLEQEDDPLWMQLVFRADGTRRILKRKARGDCFFLGKQGCRLPTEVRPLICRLYPYDYNEQGIKEQLARGCPTELLAEDCTLLEELDMDRDEAERWHRQLYREIREERR